MMKAPRLSDSIRPFLVIMLLAVLGLPAGCATTPPPAGTSAGLTDLEMVGRFGELEKAAEQKLSAQASPGTSVLGPLCLAYSRVKRYGKLFDCLDRLEKRVQAGDTILTTDKALVSNSDATAMPNMLRAEALIELGNYQGAVEEAKVALGKVQDRLVAGIWSPKIYRLSIMRTLGLAYALGGERKNAVETIRQIEDLPLGFVGSAFTYPFRANVIARIYMALGEYGKAFEYVKDEDSAWNRAVWFLNDAAWGYSEEGPEIYVTLPKLFIRGKCLSEIGRLDEAKRTLDAILRNVRVADNGELYWLTLFERGRLAERQKNPVEAIGFYTRAIDVIEQQRSTINSEVNKIGFVGDKQSVYARLIALLIGQNRMAEAFDYVERSKSRALVDMLASKKDFAVQGLEPRKAKQLLEELETLEQDSRVEDETGKPRGNTGQRSLQIAVQEIRRRAPDFSSLVAVSSVPLEELRSLIHEGEALIEYYYQGAELYAFVLNREQLRVLRLDATGLDEQVQRFRSDIQHVNTQEWTGPAQVLYSRLWKPLEGVVREESVIIVGHGSLHYLPFAALLNPDGSVLIEHFRLRFLPSASVLKFLRPALATKEAKLLVFGNPDLGDAALDLQFAESEAKEVASLYPDSRMMIRREASETNFKKAAGLFQRFHFATHGKFQAEAPLESRLFLARDGDNDGMLTAGELYTMNMDADLVTLSACETGLGKVANGDDVVGLTRGFLYAGSRSVVASLWSVDDQATAELMKTFYENLGGMSKDRALAEAQIKIRKMFPPPFFWAAFQLTGRAE
jgi:CHAT domain-containing protein